MDPNDVSGQLFEDDIARLYGDKEEEEEEDEDDPDGDLPDGSSGGRPPGGAAVPE